MGRRNRLMISLAFLGPALTSIPVCWADNPVVQTKYTADPAPLVYKDTVYLYTSHDEDISTALGNFNMYNWLLYTSTDMVNWTDHGIIAGTKAPNKTFTWAQDNGAWAPQVIERNGKFYLYAPIVATSGQRTIAVAVADNPFGPFKDALGKGLVSTGTSDDIDPTVFIDSDGQAYLYWGNPNCYYVKLNADMISTSGTPTKIPKLQTYQEGPWLYRRENNYYLAFSSTCCPEGIGYAMSTTPTGPWTYKGSMMDPNSQANGNHPGIIEFKGNSYVFGFNWRLQEKRTGARNKEMRSVAVEKFTYNADGTIPKLPFWSEKGPDQVGTLDPYTKTEAETIAWGWDVRTETCSEGGINVTAIENGDYIKVRGADFGAGATSLDLRVATTASTTKVEVRLDTLTGKLVGTCAITSTGAMQTWATQTCAISGASGIHDLFFVFTGGSGSLLNFNWWKFYGQGGTDGGTGTDAATAVDAATKLDGPTGAGGTIATGGTIGTGGAIGTGGSTTVQGGSVASGGVLRTGGNSGGQGGVGGSIPQATGGSSSTTGGAPSQGGAVATGGSKPSTTGGTVNTGGVSSSGSGGAQGGTTVPPTTSTSSSGCSCTFGGAHDRHTGSLIVLVGFGAALSLVGRRRRRH